MKVCFDSAKDLRDFLSTLSNEELNSRMLVTVETKNSWITGDINSAELGKDGKTWFFNIRTILKSPKAIPTF